MGIGKISRPAVFLDRDGVVNPTVLNPATGRMESPLTLGAFHMGEGVADALRRLQDAGYPLILVSNQPNYALGKSSFQTVSNIHDRMVRNLDDAGVNFTRFCYCLHHPRGVTPGYGRICECRKPSPWFLLRARDDFGLTLSDSWMVGDQPIDTQCGRAAGVSTVVITGNRIATADSDACADYFAADLAEAADVILSHRSY